MKRLITTDGRRADEHRPAVKILAAEVEPRVRRHGGGHAGHRRRQASDVRHALGHRHAIHGELDEMTITVDGCTQPEGDPDAPRTPMTRCRTAVVHGDQQ